MTPKQQRFCEEYLVDLNGTQAAIRAGYSARTANRIASENLTKPDIQARIQELMAERSEASKITSEWVIEQLAKIVKFDIRKLFDESGRTIPVHELDDDTAFALAGIDVTELLGGKDVPPSMLKKFKSLDKRAALELIGRARGAFVDRIEQTTTHHAEVRVIEIPNNNRGD